MTHSSLQISATSEALLRNLFFLRCMRPYPIGRAAEYDHFFGRFTCRTMIVLLAGLLILQSVEAQVAPANKSMKQSIAALPMKTHIELQLTDGNTERGRIVNRAENDFTLKRDKGAGEQIISYDQVRSASKLKSSHSRAKWIVIGVVAGAAVFAIVLGVEIARHGIGLRNVGHF